MLLIRTTIVILTKLTYNLDMKIRTGFLQLIIHQWNFQYIFLNLKTLLDHGRCALSQPLAGQLICEFIIMPLFKFAIIHQLSWHIQYAICYCHDGISDTNCLQVFAHSEELLHHIYFQDFSLKMQVWLSFKNFPWLPYWHYWRWGF